MADKQERLRALAHLAKLPAFLSLFWQLMNHPKVSGWLKLSVVAAIAYIFSPLDLIPDPFTGIGLVDDLIFALLTIERFISLAPTEVVRECAREAGFDPERLAEEVEEAVLALSASFALLWTLIERSRDKLVERFSRKLSRLVPPEGEEAAGGQEEAAGQA